VLHALPEGDRAAQVEALVHFLASTGAQAHSIPDAAAAERGAVLFHRVGCAACHNPQTEDAASLETSVPLGDLKSKYSIHGLADFLREPHKVRPSGRMPSLFLNEQESLEIANYLLQGIEVHPNVKFAAYEGQWNTLPD